MEYGIGSGSGRSSHNGGISYPYANSRRTITPSQASLPYLPALQRCVTTLEMSVQSLKSSVSVLDEATNGCPRLKTITSHTKQFELMSEQDIADARIEVSKEVEPQLFSLTEKAVKIVLNHEGEEYQLMERVRIETERHKMRIERQKAAKSGISKIKRLQSLTRRKEEHSRSQTELDEVLDQKREEVNQLYDQFNSTGKAGSVKRLRRNPTNESRELRMKIEERRKEIARRNQRVLENQQKIDDKQRSLNELRSKAESWSRSNPSGQDNFEPSPIWTMYSEHHGYLEQVWPAGFHVDPRDQDAYKDAFSRLTASYLRELESRQAKTDKELGRLTEAKTRKLAQMRNLCRQLFPGDSIGLTMVRVLELLVESPQSEIYHKDLVQNAFPPEEERRHNLGRVVAILKQVGVIELVLESRVEELGEDAQDGEPRRSEEQLVLRIKFEDPN
ncbi:hypothetical protein BGZ54_010568 [Gamsiella multidivaricata]|nr:hypothetical protein BGZ54_010568 [Gamsiella multidivaricata]